MIGHDLFANYDPSHVDRVPGPLCADKGPHDRPIGVPKVGIEHIEVALVGGQVHRLAHDAAGMVQPRQRLMQLHQIGEIPIGRIAPPTVQIMHERWAPGRTKHARLTAQLNRIVGVSRKLRELRGGRGCDRGPTEARRKPHSGSINVATRVRKYLQDFGIVLKLHPDVCKDRVGILLDLLQPRETENIKGCKFS